MPICTAILGFVTGRLGGVLDRRRERREIEMSRAPSFTIEPYGTGQYRIVNSGTATATGIGIVLDDGVRQWLPKERELAPNESAIIVTTNKVHQVRVLCNELAQAQFVPVPG